MNIRVMFAVCACKLSRFGIRLLGGNGTDFPGRVALKLCPDLLGRLAKNVKTIIITGTNGKTTTARMVEQVLADSEISYFANRSGANLLTGIAAEYAINAAWTGKPKKQFAVIESDEAAFKHVAKYTDPAAVIITNLFRDQLDRYGEVTGTLDNLRLGVESSPHAVLCLNGDDSMTASLGADAPNEVVYYGVDTPMYDGETGEVSDAPLCIRCKHPYEYDYVTYGHLGGYRCPECGWQRPAPQVSVTRVDQLGLDGSSVQMQVRGEDYPALINVAGGFNLYNACAAVAAGVGLGLDAKKSVGALATFSVGFGRMEKFVLDGVEMRMILVKNPAGVNQVLNFLKSLTEPSFLVFCLTDKVSDGTDISWIWDVNMERLAELGDLVTGVVFGGNRAEDMALRAKYAGFDMSRAHICKDNDQLIKQCIAQKRPVYIMPTYNAMMDLRELLTKDYGLASFWA